ncbi:transposase [Mesorhizobium sp.]|uniref:IS66-like element accessory protein TnpA n=1 Tax=Mesorhizobium sp. TaxID=1871066 RepID=UPI000FE472ED|nr:transposase [Mesorhizobium sp.]RWP56725.1 MAG: transposase [Mesorhizobium sp.]
MTISEFTLKSKDEEPVRRLEIFTGSGRRREWPPKEKARIVAESYEAGETVCAVARRYGLAPQQLFTWRRAARRPMGETAISESMFVPAVVTAAPPKPAAKHRPQPRKREPARDAGVIELEIDGIAMRVAVAAVIRALRATS